MAARRRVSGIPWILAAVLSLFAGKLQAFQTADLVAGHRVYELLDDLSREGVILTRIAGIQPLPRVEVARLLEEARRRSETRELPSALRSRLERALERFRADLFLFEGKHEGATAVRPLDELTMVLREQGAFAEREGDVGRSLSEGFASFASLSAFGTISPGIAFALQPEIRYERMFSTGEGNSGIETRLLDGYVRLPTFGWDFTAGRQSLRWGQGRHDTLILSNDAAPLNLLRLSSRTTGLTFAGATRVDMFVAQLEQDRTVEHALLGGIKINFKPWTWFEFGLSRTFQFGGEGRSIPLFEILFPSDSTENRTNNREERDPSNQLAGFDWRMESNGYSFYGEWIGDDISDGLPSRLSHILGVEISSPLSLDDVSLFVEYAVTHKESYSHNVYRDGYTYRDFNLGHHIGQDAHDFYVGVVWDLTDRTRVELGYDYEASNHSGRIFETDDPRFDVIQRLNEGRLEIRHDLSTNLTLFADARYVKVDNLDYEDGHDDDEWIWEAGFTLRF